MKTRIFALLIGLDLAGAVVLPTQPDVKTIIARSVAANDRDWAAAPKYNFKELDRFPGATKTYQVMMIRGSQYNRLTLENGKPLPPDRNAREERRLATVRAARRAESPEETAERVAKYKRDRQRDHWLLSQLGKAFDFKFGGEQQLGSYKVYVLHATPRAGYQPPNTETRVLLGMEGTLWIDEKTFQWVKVEAHVIRPVSIEGFLARVEPGTYFELEKAPVTDGVWLRKHFAMRANAKILFLYSHRSQADETYFNYQPAAE